MIISGKQLIQRFDAYCPQWLAEKGDPVGLAIGTLDKEVQRVLITLDVRPEVVQEAIDKKIDLIIAKHPPIFRPVTRLTTDDPQTKMYADLLKNDIAVFAAHTNLDIMKDGLNDWLCAALDIKETTYLRETHVINYKQLSVYVPVEQAQAMRDALSNAGAGQQGNYQKTSYTLIGKGRFTPVASAKPAIGLLNQETTVQEAKIEVIFPETLQEAVLAAMYAVHPYEEPAFSIHTIENQQQRFGIGRVGMLEAPLPLEEFVGIVKATFGLDGLRLITANQQAMIQRVAICGGSGEKFFMDAKRMQADVYITGDVYYHTGHDMLANHLPVIDAGHYIEQLCKSKLVQQLNEWKKNEDWEIMFMESKVNTNPFTFM